MTDTDEGNESAGDRIADDARDIQRTAEDLARAREEEIAIEGRRTALADEKATLEKQVAELQARLGDVSRREDELAEQEATLHCREIADEARIRTDLDDAEHASGSACGGSMPPPREYEFFVDGKPYTTELPKLTGRQIKAKVPDWDPTHDLSLEGLGGAPDRLIGDDQEVDFAAAVAPLHFSSVPRATFG